MEGIPSDLPTDGCIGLGWLGRVFRYPTEWRFSTLQSLSEHLLIASLGTATATADRLWSVEKRHSVG
jgi:hypothetical protein